MTELISLICNVNMMNKALIELELDPVKMPLGKLSKKQIKKGYDILKEIEDLLKATKMDKTRLIDCSNRFYTNIPHRTGMKVPPLIDTKPMLLKKMEMLEVLI